MEHVLVEFYSHRTPENLISLLKGRYDGAFFLYFPEEEPKKRIREQIGRVVQEILGFSPTFIKVPERSAETVLETLKGLMKNERRITIDITGGNEIFIAASGMFLALNQNRNLSLHQYDVPTGKAVFRFPEKEEEPSCFPRNLNVPQVLSLGGTPPLSAPQYSFGYGPLREEILKLWNAVKRNPKDWNAFCSLPCDPERTRSSVTQKYIGTEKEKKRAYFVIAAKLKAAGILQKERETVLRGKHYMEFDLNVPKEALFLYDKAGTLLEMYTALAAYDAGVFHDIRVGVTVDWNGNTEAPHHPDPRNEIDLVLMRESLPILASCKNTYPQNEYLYEIMTMARHYGGFFATPMLLSSGSASPTVRQRAKEMGIVLIDSIRRKSYGELVKHFTALFS